MKKTTVLGIFRERSHSPQRESDDEAILRQTAEELGSLSALDIHLMWPEEFLGSSLDVLPSLVFYMCEEVPCLDRLRTMGRETGCVLVNTVESVENTFRENMISVLGKQAFFPESRMISADDAVSRSFSRGCWLKRGDFHAITQEDVVFAKESEVTGALARFSQRGIKRVMVQEHVPGDIIKFYCIRDCNAAHTWWFKWFYHKDQDLKGYGFSGPLLMKNCLEAGDSMGLDIYGGDAIVTPEGNVFIIDVNAWPSFALFRKEAAGFIAQLLAAKLVDHAGIRFRPDAGQQTILNLSV